MSGTALGVFLARGSRFPLDEIVRLMTQLLAALAHGVVHRDLKPANMFSAAGRLAQGGGLRHRACRGLRPQRERAYTFLREFD
ncbi:MAG: hypothetical protein HY017_31140 [Betaproteobacteria bacterium]|nr:hypothetical protein [Betaproteobacteria bacterium]